MRTSICFSALSLFALVGCGGSSTATTVTTDMAHASTSGDAAVAANDMATSASTDMATSATGDMATASTDAGATTATFAQVFSIFQNEGCLSCHMTTPWDNGENLTGQALVTHLTGTKSSECASLPFVTPNDPDKSYLYQKVTGKGSCFTGSSMPLGDGPLDAKDADTIKAWILNGATAN